MRDRNVRGRIETAIFKFVIINGKMVCNSELNRRSKGGLFVSYCVCLVTQSCSTLCDPVDCSPPASSVHGDSPGKSTRGLPPPSPGDLPNSGIECLYDYICKMESESESHSVI